MKYYTQYLLNLIFLFVLSACSDSASITTEPKKPRETSKVFGGVDGGGGTGVMCGDKVMTLDLFEARSRGLAPAPKNVSDNFFQNLKYFGEKYSLHFDLEDDKPPVDSFVRSRGEIMAEEFRAKVLAKFKDIPSGTHLEISEDATLPQLPAGCRFVQVAFYDDRVDKIYRDSKYWAKMDAVDQAALIAHEYIYRKARNGEVYDSDGVRRLIGHFYSDLPLEPVVAPVWNVQRKLSCSAGNAGESEVFKFYGVEEAQDGQSGVAFYFETFKDAVVITRLRTFFPGTSLVKLVDRSELNFSTLALQKTTSQEWEIEFNKHFGDRYFTMRANFKNNEPPIASLGACKWDPADKDL